MSEMGAATEAAVSFHPVGNLCRVCGLLVGVLLVIALIAYAAIPPVYEARCEFAFGCRGRFPNDNGVDVGMHSDSGSYEEIFNYQRQITQLSQAIVSADAGLRQLKKEREVSAMMLKDLRQRENEAHICCERDNEVVTVLKRAEVPTRPCNFIPKLFWILSGGRCHAK